MKIKEMNTIDWVKLAVSRDDTRYNLKEVYRDTNCLVATDGRRLHLSNGLPDVAPHYPSGLDGQFPNWHIVMPRGKESCTLELSNDYASRIVQGETIKRLERLYALLKIQKSETLRIVRLSIYPADGEGVCHLRVRYDDADITFSAVIPCLTITGKHPDIGINLGYLIDALRLNHIAPVTMRLYGKESALTLTTEHQTALIMPAKL